MQCPTCGGELASPAEPCANCAAVGTPPGVTQPAEPMPSKDLLFSVMHEQMTRAGHTPPTVEAEVKSTPLPRPVAQVPPSTAPEVSNRQATATYEAAPVPAPPTVSAAGEWPPSQPAPLATDVVAAGSAPTPSAGDTTSARQFAEDAQGNSRRSSKAPLIVGGIVVALFVGVAIAGSVVSSLGGGSGDSAAPIAEASTEGPMSDDEIAPIDPVQDPTESAVDDGASYEGLSGSWSALSGILQEYGTPRAGDTVPLEGWLKDEFGPRIGDADLAVEAREWADRFEAGRADLEGMTVSDAYASDKESQLAIWTLAARRADAYAQIAEDAVNNDEAHWRALQNSLGTKSMKDELLSMLDAYAPPQAP